MGGLPPINLRLGEQLHREGYPLAAYFGRIVVGARIVNGNAVDVMCKRENGPPTLCLTQAADGAPADTAPVVYMGTPTPRWEGSVHATLSLFGAIRFYGLVDFKGGHVANTGDAAHFNFFNT